MGIQIAAAGILSRGAGLGPAAPHDLPQNSETLRRSQAKAEERKDAALARFESAFPGNREASQRADLRSASLDLEQIGLAFNRKLKFMVDHESNDITVKVIDRETDKVIKELPPEELQRMHAKIRETIGFLFDEKV